MDVQSPEHGAQGISLAPPRVEKVYFNPPDNNNIMSDEKKLDVLDFIIHTLTDHERHLDTLAERLDASIDRIEHTYIEYQLEREPDTSKKIEILRSRIEQLEKMINIYMEKIVAIEENPKIRAD